MEEQTHYVCPECGGVSDASGVCETDGCLMEGEDLQECTCEDGEHDEVMSSYDLDDEDDDYYDDEDEDY